MKEFLLKSAVHQNVQFQAILPRNLHFPPNTHFSKIKNNKYMDSKQEKQLVIVINQLKHENIHFHQRKNKNRSCLLEIQSKCVDSYSLIFHLKDFS